MARPLRAETPAGRSPNEPLQLAKPRCIPDRQQSSSPAAFQVTSSVKLPQPKLAPTDVKATTKPYDQDEWAALADVSTVSPLVSLAKVAAIHERFVAVVRLMDSAAFARTLVHPENGRMTIGQVVALYAWHADQHVAQIRGMRNASM